MQNWQRTGSLLLRLATCGALVALAAPAGARGWAWPVQGPVLRTFEFGSDPYAAGLHRGVDIGAGADAPVVAPASGVVFFAGSVPTGGRTLAVETPDGYSVTLLHLGALAVERGAAVSEGEVIGSAGSSGVPEQSVPYVHLGVRRVADPQGYVDPLLFLPPAAQPPVPGEPPEPQPVPGSVPVAPPPTSPAVVAPPTVVRRVAELRPTPARPRLPLPQGQAARTRPTPTEPQANAGAPRAAASVVEPQRRLRSARPALAPHLAPAPEDRTRRTPEHAVRA
ncbi:MAG TPA: peptidoglycan DD-metalloendopeptidase family protein, partial [Gaiellaceae bacterium]|nr:peptidoglycan DD-metalloendopeptidase family protein [Gaiellaceae bacterium]